MSYTQTKLVAFLVLPILASLTAFAHGREPAAKEIPAEENRLTAHRNAVQVELPDGTVKVSYVESEEGMMVYVESKGVVVRGRKLFLGDGMKAVRFEASTKGFVTAEGIQNVSGVAYASGAVLPVAKEFLHPWGQQPGEVYILTPGIRFKAKP